MLKVLALIAFLHGQHLGQFSTQSTTISDTYPQVMYVRSQREVHFKHTHVAVTINYETGVVTGAYLRRNGTVYCTIVGTYDVPSQCLHVDVCGAPEVACASVD